MDATLGLEPVSSEACNLVKITIDLVYFCNLSVFLITCNKKNN